MDSKQLPFLLLAVGLVVVIVFGLRRGAPQAQQFPPGTFPPPPRLPGASAPTGQPKSNLVGTIATGACVGATIYYSAGAALPLCGLAAPFATGVVHLGENIVGEIGSWF